MTTVYEPIYPWEKWSDRLTFSPAVRVGDLLFISGLTATDENLDIVGPNDIVAQTRHIFLKMGDILAAAGGGFDKRRRDGRLLRDTGGLFEDGRGTPRVLQGSALSGSDRRTGGTFDP